MASLAQLLTPWQAQLGTLHDATITGMTLDSRQVQAGDLFVAMPGDQVDGRAFISKAVSAGAAAVLAEAEGADDIDLGLNDSSLAPVIRLPGLQQKLGAIAARFYGEPSRQLHTVGITGTNGKTSCCQFAAQALNQAGEIAGVMGTLGYGLLGQLTEATHTTPDAIRVQQHLAEMRDQGAETVVMEVSSHALDQGRVNGVSFDTAVFTNLSRDHLDYHGTMQRYGASKRQLFFMPGIKQAVLNIDDSFGAELAETLNSAAGPDYPCYGYGLENARADINASQIQLTAEGMQAQLTSPWGQGLLKSKLLGRFNLSNLLAVYSILCLQGKPHEEAITALAALSVLPGRMERFGGGDLPTVVVDYAHTPDALERALSTLAEMTTGRLICVFGCGGNRDQGKRADMGQIAASCADQVWITNDNPRDEDPKTIAANIFSGAEKASKKKAKVAQVKVELDRETAIAGAIKNAQAGDLVLVAGKGHEAYQEVAGERLPFKDTDVVLELLSKLTQPQGIKPGEIRS